MKFTKREQQTLERYGPCLLCDICEILMKDFMKQLCNSCTSSRVKLIYSVGPTATSLQLAMLNTRGKTPLLNIEVSIY